MFKDIGPSAKENSFIHRLSQGAGLKWLTPRLVHATSFVTAKTSRHLRGDDNMQTILPSEFKRQMVLMLDGSPHVIEDMHTSGTAQTRHKLHTRLRHLTTGRLIDRVFAENERVPVAPLETRRATYSYAKADGQVFIDIETFDEFEFSNEQLGERRWFLKENEEYKALRLDGRLLDIVLPPQIPLKVVDTAPPARSGLNTSWKEAKLETGLQVMVPLFIANGDIIRVDTAGKKYLGKETSGA
jgi:elongation factor P